MQNEIEQMAKVICHAPTCEIRKNGGTCYKYCKAYIYAFRAINAGYRKADEIAEEVINTALSKIQIMISAIKALEESGYITEFNGGAKSTLEIVFKDLVELKKKYTEEGK